MTTSIKTCLDCKSDKPATEFYRNSRTKGGRLNKCRGCAKAQNEAIRKTKPEYYAAYAKQRASIPAVREARLAYRKKWKANNAIKNSAGSLARKAVATGLLTKASSCEQCGKASAAIHGHHDDYSKPLDVRWLCPLCHAAWHHANGEGLNARRAE